MTTNSAENSPGAAAERARRLAAAHRRAAEKLDHHRDRYLELAEAQDRAATAFDKLSRAFANMQLDAIQELSDDEVELVDRLMRDNPDWGWVDALDEIWTERMKHVRLARAYRPATADERESRNG